MAEVETSYEYTSVDGTVTRSRSSRFMGVLKFTGGILLLAFAFLAGTTQDSFLGLLSCESYESSTTSSSISTALPQDFKASKLQVAVSDDGKAILVALPAKRLYGIYQMRQKDDKTWETSLLEEGHTIIRRLYFAKNPQYGTLSTFWADRDLTEFQTETSIPTTAGQKKGKSIYPVQGQSPFPQDDRYHHFPNIAFSEEATPRIVLLSMDPDMTLRVYAFGSGQFPRYEQQGQINCTDFGPQECLSEFGYDDEGSILSYQWLDNSTVAVDMCTIGRCSIHVFEEDPSRNSWSPTVNFTRPPKGAVIFSSRDIQQKMIQTELEHSRGHYLPKNLTIRTWSREDRWEVPSNQTFALPKYELLEHHYLSIPRQPMLSKDGSVLCVTWSNTYENRPISIEVLTEAWIFHWDSSTAQWNLYDTVELGKDILQVELSGNGQRLVLFQKDYSFSVKDL